MSVTKKLFIVFLFYTAVSVHAAPNRLLSGVEVSSEQNKELIDIKFTVPINYTAHFPATSGKSLLIDIRAFLSESKLVLTSSNGEKSRIADNQSKLLSLIRVESLDNNTGKLALQFKKSVIFSVRQTDKKTIQLSVTRETKKTSTAPARSARTAATKKTTATVPFKSVSSASTKSANAKIIYVLNLESYKKSKKPRNIPNLDIFDEYKLFRTRVKTRNKIVTRLRLGFFKNKSTANRVKKLLKTYYPNVWLDVIQKNEGSLSKKYFVAVKARKKPSKKPTKTTVASTTKPISTKQQNKIQLLMEKGDLAFIEKRFRHAISFYTKVFNIAKGKQQQLALERIGVTRERNGQLAHAKAEYEKYLSLYKQGEGHDRVKQLLEGILTAQVEPKKALVSSKKVNEDESQPWEIYNSLSQNYDYRQNKTVSGGSSTTTSDDAFSTYFSSSATKSTKDYDLGVVFYGDHRYNFSDTTDPSQLGVASLYFDYISRTGLGSLRLGRQSRTTGGVFGRYDGVWYGYPYSNDITLNVVAGLPVESGDGITTNTHQTMYGASVDFDNVFERVDVSTFIIEQQVDGILDRRAIGGELRSISNSSSSFAYIDYDVSYNMLNTFFYVGNWIFNRKSLNVVADYRLSPLITTSAGLSGQGLNYIEELLQFISEADIRQLAKERTADSTSLTISGTMELNQKYSLNGDIVFSEVSGTPASTIGGITVEKVIGVGLETSVSVQLLGNNLFSTRDTNIINLRITDSSTRNTISLDGRSQFNLNPKWRIRPRARFETQSRSGGIDVFRFQPSIRFDYRYNRDLQFNFETGIDFAQTSDSTNGDSDSTDFYITLEYIYDFEL